MIIPNSSPLGDRTVLVFDTHGTIVASPLDEDLVAIARVLPDDTWRYFEQDEEAVLLDLDRLVRIRARTAGIRNAVDLMRRASAGEIPRRQPISVQAIGDGYFKVLDGNSTVTIAIAAGWRQAPCIIIPAVD